MTRQRFTTPAAALAAALAAVFVLGAAAAAGDAEPDHGALTERALERHVLPGFERLAAATEALATALAEPAAAYDREKTVAAYHDAFDAWMGVSHLAFGPLEAEGRAFAIAFWPDPKGSTAKTLRRLIATEDPAVDDAAAFADLSVAARGLFALDRLLFDPDLSTAGTEAYRRRLAAAIGVSLRDVADEVLAGWPSHAALMRSAGAEENLTYLTETEPTQALYKAALGGLQATIDLRLGGPLGTLRRPRPKRAEAWRSDRPLRNIRLSLEAVERLHVAAFAPALNEEEAAPIRAAFAYAKRAADRAPAPLTEAVGTASGRVKIDALRGALEALRERLEVGLGIALGVAPGFNALDGD